MNVPVRVVPIDENSAIKSSYSLDLSLLKGDILSRSVIRSFLAAGLLSALRMYPAVIAPAVRIKPCKYLWRKTFKM